MLQCFVKPKPNQKWVKRKGNLSEFHLERNYLLQNWYFSNNFKVFGLYSCLKNWKCHIKTALSQVKDIAGIVLNNEIGFVYEKDTHDNDYIILKLGSPLQFNENVQPACLPSSSSFLGLDSTKTSCFTSGWGKLNFSKL